MKTELQNAIDTFKNSLDNDFILENNTDIEIAKYANKSFEISLGHNQDFGINATFGDLKNIEDWFEDDMIIFPKSYFNEDDRATNLRLNKFEVIDLFPKLTKESGSVGISDWELCTYKDKENGKIYAGFELKNIFDYSSLIEISEDEQKLILLKCHNYDSLSEVIDKVYLQKEA